MKKIICFVIFLALTGCGLQGGDLQKLEVQTAQGVFEFDVEVANTTEERAKGLMNRAEMLDSRGMVFLFSKPDIQTFWMKDTLLPLDIIFINGNWEIVKIDKNVQPCGASEDKDCALYRADNSQYVLEINAGLADKNAFNVGDKVVLK